MERNYFISCEGNGLNFDALEIVERRIGDEKSIVIWELERLERVVGGGGGLGNRKDNGN